jgi:hypothetical protein
MGLGSILKEGFIFVLLTVVVIFLLMLLLSDFRPTDEQAPVVTYSVDGNVKATLEEVDTATGGDSEDIESLLKSYTVDASDLKIYETAKSYESGKSNPFDEIPPSQYENTVTEVGTGATGGTSTGKGSTPGKFFGGSTK